MINFRNGSCIQVDDDVFLPPFALMSLLRSGPAADERGCGVLLPLTQNGIPSTELFARRWLSETQLNVRMAQVLSCQQCIHLDTR